MKFNLRYEGEDGSVVEFATGRTSLWDAQDYAWAFFAARQAGKLAELGVPEGCEVEEGLRYLADNYDFSIARDDDEEEAPLASKPAK